MEGELHRPLLIVVSAPSGAGKTTLCERLLAERDDIVYSVSCTTRPSRGAERDGEDYFFISEAAFLERVAGDEFLEHAVVHGYHYGTLRKTVSDALASGRSVLMDIDVQGAAQIREAVARAPEGDVLREAFLDIFIEPPSLDDLRCRLEGRGEDAADVIERRLENAAREMAGREDYRYRIVNDDLDRAYADLEACLEKEQKEAGSEPPDRN